MRKKGDPTTRVLGNNVMSNGDVSILTTVKAFAGIDDMYTYFDESLIPLINSELSALTQLGVGSEDDPVGIEDKFDTWSIVTTDKQLLGLIPEYVSIRVRLVFDPPQNFVAESLKARASELAFRIQHRAEMLML